MHSVVLQPCQPRGASKMGQSVKPCGICSARLTMPLEESGYTCGVAMLKVKVLGAPV